MRTSIVIKLFIQQINIAHLPYVYKLCSRAGDTIENQTNKNPSSQRAYILDFKKQTSMGIESKSSEITHFVSFMLLSCNGRYNLSSNRLGWLFAILYNSLRKHFCARLKARKAFHFSSNSNLLFPNSHNDTIVLNRSCVFL